MTFLNLSSCRTYFQSEHEHLSVAKLMTRTNDTEEEDSKSVLDLRISGISVKSVNIFFNRN